MIDMLKKNGHYLAAIVLLWLLFAQAVRGAVTASITFDEGPHLAVGYATLRTGDFRLQPVHIHPPLVNMIAAAPLLLDPSLPDPRSIPGWDIASLSAVTDAVVWKHSPPDGIALAGRLPVILLAVLLGAFVYRWAADLAGRKAGLLALFLYALDPNIVAHAQVITTDMGVTVFGFLALYFCFKAQRQNTKYQISNLKSANLQSKICYPKFQGWDIGTGLALGAALVTKVSAGLLAPLIAVIVLATGRDTIAKRIGRVVVTGLIAFVVVWATYGFEVRPIAGIRIPIPAATHVEIYQSLQQHYDEGHPSFLMGMNSMRGWWYYFSVAFLVKTPLPTLTLLLVSVVLAIGRWRSEVKSQKAETRNWRASAGWTLGLFPVVHFATALWSSVDIGYRHLLPILPFLFVFIGAQVVGRTRSAQVTGGQAVSLSPPHLVSLSMVLLLAWYAVSAALIFPHNLAYFNQIAGGPDNGYKWLVDSNLDWGQNLKELKVWLDERGISRVYLSQFSPARPEVYGLQATLLPPSPRAAPFARFDPAPGWYVIGATTLQGAYTPDVDTFAYFRMMTPTARIGHALFVYHVPEQPRGEWVAQCANPSLPLDAEEIKAGFGHDDLRLVHFDCSKSWWYPSGGMPGWYVDSTGRRLAVSEWFPSALATYQPHDQRATFSAVYRVDNLTPPAGRTMQAHAAPGDWPPAQAMAQGSQIQTPVAMTGPLQFMGFWLYGNPQTAPPGGQLLVLTTWRVMRSADSPLSIMAHLLDAQGRRVSGADGLGVPMELWQTGDMIVQAHWLDIPKNTAQGTYWIQTGVYRLDNMERYRILQNGQAVGDRLLLAPIEVRP